MTRSADRPNAERRLLAFIANELAPTPGRLRATIRIAAACAIATTVVMAFHIPDGEFLLISIFIVGMMDAWASVEKAAMRVLGTLVGGAVALVGVAAFADKPLFLFLLQGVVVAATLFGMRTSTAPYAVMMMGVTFLIIMPEYVASPSVSLDRALLRTGLTAAGALIGTLAQLLPWPDDSEPWLLDDLAAHLAHVPPVLDRMLADPATWTRGGDAAVPPDLGAATGLVRRLDWVAQAEARSRSLRRRHTEQLRLVTDVEILGAMAWRLRRLMAFTPLPATLDDAARTRVGAIRDECALLQQALATRQPPKPPPQALAEPGPAAGTDALTAELLPSLHEMERALVHVREAVTLLVEGRETDGVFVPDDGETQPRVFTAACTLRNGPVLRFALKGTLAASLAGLFYEAVDWPGISTCVLTCMIVAQSTVGADLRKSMLRLVAAAIGGLVGVFAIVVFLPNLESVAGLVVLSTVLFAAAAWILRGSTKTSYAGLQIGLALCLVLVNGLGQAPDLVVARDRVIGIGVGVIATAFVDLALWPVFAAAGLHTTVAATLRDLAAFERSTLAGDRRDAHTRNLQIYRDLASALSQYDDAELEAALRREGPGHRPLLPVVSRAQDTFVRLLALGRNGFALQAAGVPDAVRAEIGVLDEAAARWLESVAGRIDGTGPGAPVGPLVASLRSAAAPTTPNLAPAVVAALADRAILYHELGNSLERLEASVAAKLAADRAAAAAPSGVGIPAPA